MVCDFCHEHLEQNKAAFESSKLELIHDDARAQLEAYPGKFDVIIGDLADPLDGGPCYQLYTQVSSGKGSKQQAARGVGKQRMMRYQYQHQGAVRCHGLAAQH